MIDPELISCIADIPRIWAAKNPNREAISGANFSLTFAELEKAAKMASAGLTARGIQRGDRIAWLGENSAAFFIAFFGAVRANACLTPVNLRLSDEEIGFIVGNSGAAHWIVSPAFQSQAIAIAAKLTPSPTVFTVDELTQNHDGNALDAESSGNDNDAVLQLYTSGTTGFPKGVCLTNRNYRAFLHLSTQMEGFNYRDGQTVLMVMPLYHVAGMNVSLASLGQGCRLIVKQSFDPVGVLTTIEREKVSHVFLVPAMIQALLQTKEIATTDLSNLETVAYGASAISEAVLHAARARFPSGFVQFYGMTESTGSGTSLAPSQHSPELSRSCGRQWPGLEVEILDSSGQPVPDGEIGEIAIRGDTVMAGYWKNPDATRKATLDGSWLRTGDVGYRDAAGFVFVHDRLNDMIISGAENIYPAEVENAIFGCPGVVDVAVIGIPSEKWGEEVCAIVVPDRSNRPTQESIIGWSRQRIAGYKLPKSVKYLDELPRNSSGKVLRRQLRKLYWDQQD